MNENILCVCFIFGVNHFQGYIFGNITRKTSPEKNLHQGGYQSAFIFGKQAKKVAISKELVFLEKM